MAFAEKSSSPKFYFNFKAERKKLKDNQTNFTSPVTLIIGLNESLKMLQAEGLENAFRRHERLAHATRRLSRRSVSRCSPRITQLLCYGD